MSKAQTLALVAAKARRGATMIEYALVIVAIMLLAAGLFRTLGNSAKTNAQDSSNELQKRGN